jgi:hypothetical protein
MNRFGLLSATAIVLCASAALAQVQHEGTWPVELKHVTIDAAHLTRTEAVTRLAKEAGWSIVTRFDDDGKTMDLHVTDQPADKVLDVILESDDFVAKRDGTLITLSNAKKTPAAISSASVTPPPIPPPIVATPAATTRGEDRLVRGGDLVVGADETVHDVAVFAGSVQIYGTATGNVTVIGGSASIKKNAHIVGSATAVGGSIDIADGAQVDGDVGVVGGSLDRHKGAKIGGAIHKNEDIRVGNSSSGTGHSLLREVSDATTRAAMLFVFGAVLFALAGLRMNALRIEAASRPMRSFALGIVGGLLGLASIGIIGITIIGLPVAAVLLLAAVFASYAGVCAVLATVGKALVGHKSDNPHVHLLVGCVLFLVSGAIPFINGLVTAAVVLTGIGVVVATRGAGTLSPNGTVNDDLSYAGPYRT